MILTLLVEVPGQPARRFEFQRSAVRLGPPGSRADVTLPLVDGDAGGIVLRVSGSDVSLHLDPEHPPVTARTGMGTPLLRVWDGFPVGVGTALLVGPDEAVTAVIVIESLQKKACAAVRVVGAMRDPAPSPHELPAWFGHFAAAAAMCETVDDFGDIVADHLGRASCAEVALLVPDAEPHHAPRLVVAGQSHPAPVPGCLQPGSEAFGRLVDGHALEVTTDNGARIVYPLHVDHELVALLGFSLSPADLADGGAHQGVAELTHALIGAVLRRLVRHELLLELEEENRFYRDRQRRHYLMKDLVAESPAMRQLHRELQERVAGDEPVLLAGEAGTGKELLARALHHLGGRGAAALVSEHCGALDEHEMTLDFFGFRRVDERGQHVWRRGIFELADGGTVFLDEIHVLPLAIQARLQRVLTEHEVFRADDSQARRVDVRVVASTHLDLLQLADEGRFRRDLALLLMRNRLLVPALRDRREDFDALVSTFVRAYARRYRRPSLAVESATLEWLRSLSWPGNVRELQTVLERAVLQKPPDQTILCRADFELR